MPVPYPKEFRADVVAVTRQGDKSRAHVARNFGISESCLTRCLQIADRDDGTTSSAPPTVAGGIEAEKRELRRRTNQLEEENEIPAPGDGLLRPRRPPKMYPLVLDLAADRIPVAVTCRVLGFSKQAFYKWKARPMTDRDRSDAHLINAAFDIHHDDPEFGYRFIADELPSRGVKAGWNQVSRRCTAATLRSGSAPTSVDPFGWGGQAA